MVPSRERWGILIKVYRPGQRELWRWACDLTFSPYEFESSSAADFTAKLAYANLAITYQICTIRDQFGCFIYEARYVKDNGEMW